MFQGRALPALCSVRDWQNSRRCMAQSLCTFFGPESWFPAGRSARFQRNLQINCFASLQTNLPIFKLKESCVRRRYSDFEWLKNELERDSKIVVPPLPGKALKRQLPFRGDEGIFEESFIEERRQGLEQFINKIAGHPLAQNERCLHMFLQEETIDRNYVPGKVRQ
uniref:Sorting nexin 12 n=1 Tax=Serinus canaria TaxID=9135 RepID=A0A8C9NQD3_SERCA